MVDREKNYGLVYFHLPRSEYELPGTVLETVGNLVTHPDKIGEFLSLAKDSLYLAETSGNQSGAALIKTYISETASGVGKYDWGKRRTFNLTYKAATELVMHLPDSGSTPGSRVEADLDNISVALTRGFLEKRFENSHDWRGYTSTSSVLVKAAVNGGLDSGLYEKCFDLITGKYPGIMQVNGFGWRANFVSARVVAPDDEELIKKAVDAGRNVAIMGELLDRSAELEAVSNSYAGIALQYDALVDTISLGFNPDSTAGKKMYQQLLKVGAQDSNGQGNFYGQPLDEAELIQSGVCPELKEIIAQYQKFPARGFALKAAKVEASNQDVKTNTEYMTRPADPNTFPYRVMSYVSPEREKLMGLISNATIRKKLREYADKLVRSKGGKWTTTPFITGDYAGYIIGDPVVTGIASSLSPAEQIAAINNFLDRENLQQQLKDNFSAADVRVDTGYIKDKSFEVILISPERSEKSREETFLDIHVPQSLRFRSIEILGRVMKARMSIPREFTQMPTKPGYLYHLENHQDLPGVFKEARVRLNEAGGIIVELVPQRNVLAPIDATVSFPSSHTKVEWGKIGAGLPLDLQWIAESVVLSLVKSAACIPLNENEQPRPGDFVPEGGETGKNSIPGRIGHVGGFRHSGERKQFTQIAEGKFQSAMRAMGIATGGLSLADINLQHRQIAPKCERSLTWYTGYEPEIAPAPVIRKPPERLIFLDPPIPLHS